MNNISDKPFELACIYANRNDSVVGWDYKIVSVNDISYRDGHVVYKPANKNEVDELYRRLKTKEFLYFATDEHWCWHYVITADSHKFIDSIAIDVDTTGWDDLEIFLAKYAKDLDSHPGWLSPID